MAGIRTTGFKRELKCGALWPIIYMKKEEVLKIKEEKKDSRGGFEKAIILEKVIG